MVSSTIIIEDEKPNADRLIRLIGEVNPELKIVAVLDSVSDAIEWFQNNNHPDIAFFDIRLSDGISFEILEQIKIDSHIIFTTAYDEYAVKAFKHNSVDYILKPVEKEELVKALTVVEEITALLDQQRAVEKLLDYVKPKDYRLRFLVPFRDGFQTILIDEITCIFLEQKVTKARLRNGKTVMISHNMDDLENQLDPKIFFRANRQFIIHVDTVSQLINHFNRKLKVVLVDCEFEIIVSREKSFHLKEWLDS